MKRIFYLGVAALIAIGCSGTGVKDTSAIFNKTYATAIMNTASKAISVETKEKNSTVYNVQSDYKIPVLQGLEDKEIEKRLNETFEKRVEDIETQIEKLAKGDESLGEGRSYCSDSEFKVYYNENSLISLGIMYYQYTGGAHGISILENSTIDLKTGKTISLKDIFKDGTIYKDIIDTEIKKQMNANRELYFESSISDFQGISEETSYYIERGNLVICYGLYEIAPYAAGIQQFKVPLSQLEDVIKDEYKAKLNKEI